MLRVVIAGLFGGFLAVLLAADGRASLYTPEDTTTTVPVDDDGKPETLPFDEFSRRRLILRNIGNSDWPLVETDPQTKQPVIDPKTGHPRLNERGEVDARIKKAQKKKAKDRTPDESAILATDLLRFGLPDAAAGEIRADQQRGFLPNVTLAHISAAQGQWRRGLDFLDIANEIAFSKRAPLTALPGVAPQKLKWQLALNKGPLMTLFKLRAREARARDDEKAADAKGAKIEKDPDLAPENELPDRIFDVNFVNAAGAYEPGALADSEKAKLPPDALATAQQLVLWFPYDWRLYWLLAELYAVKGEFKAAQKIMDECVYSGKYSNRKVLMQHREAVTKAANVEPPVDPDPEPPVPFTMKAVWWYFGGVGALALLALVRAVMRRGKRA